MIVLLPITGLSQLVAWGISSPPPSHNSPVIAIWGSVTSGNMWVKHVVRITPPPKQLRLMITSWNTFLCCLIIIHTHDAWHTINSLNVWPRMVSLYIVSWLTWALPALLKSSAEFQPSFLIIQKMENIETKLQYWKFSDLQIQIGRHPTMRDIPPSKIMEITFAPTRPTPMMMWWWSS